MTKLILFLFFTFSLVTNCEDKKKEESSSHHTESEMHDNTIPHDSLLVPEHQTPPIFRQDEKLPVKKNDTI